MVMWNARLSSWHTVAAAMVAIGMIAAAGCDMTPKKIEKTVKDAGTTEDQVDKVMQDFK
jgi:hypothetical protein